ncbi:uncharacterized protein [Onthophagus taurus]|uniref:uncharacterized protein n=1 Tax=Onthophagus taurus TaxID=166361 RepID=UPI0039BDB70E
MNESPPSENQEERYPLLFLFLEDGNKGAKKGRNVFFERTRSQGIITGATNVFTQFPGYISSCGLSMIIFTLTLIFLFLMILACSMKPNEHYLHPRCIKRSFDDDKDIKIYLVHNEDKWEKDQLDILEEILVKFNQCHVELITFDDCMEYPEIEEKINSKQRPKRHVKDLNGANSKNEELSINVGAKNLLQIFREKTKKYSKIFSSNKNINTSLNPFFAQTTQTTSTETPKSLNTILKTYPQLKLTKTTKKEFFEYSPLYDSWKNMNQHTLNFAARVLKLWDNAGISFKFPDITDNSEDHKHKNSLNYYKYNVQDTTNVPPKESKDKDDFKIIETMVETGYESFKKLPDGLVTVDEEGIHMETKTTCHAFFGEALNQLKRVEENSNIKKIIQDTLKTFCVKGAVDSEYCNSVKSSVI